MSKPVALVTGASGEMGHLLLPALEHRGYDIVSLDLVPLDPPQSARCVETVEASILDARAVEDLFRRHHPEIVFHLAAVLSTKAEKDPDLACDVNTNGTVALFRLVREEARLRGESVRLFFPSSIAVYGLPDARAKEVAGAVKESDWNCPAGLYGINKLYCEMLGTYFTQRAIRRQEPGIDFRAIRFPGLISAETVPSGGTSDYAPEMIHAAAQGKPYACFVRADTRLPFMTMPDAVDALLALAFADPATLTTRVYNIGAFSPSAAEIRAAVLDPFPDAEIGFEPVPSRQAIVDTWPADVDDRRARVDWGHSPRHGLREAVRDYLVPALLSRHGVRSVSR
jgi:threonine 3-dehydrogenase